MTSDELMQKIKDEYEYFINNPHKLSRYQEGFFKLIEEYGDKRAYEFADTMDKIRGI